MKKKLKCLCTVVLTRLVVLSSFAVDGAVDLPESTANRAHAALDYARKILNRAHAAVRSIAVAQKLQLSRYTIKRLGYLSTSLIVNLS
jgi:hypothetical protein